MSCTAAKCQCTTFKPQKWQASKCHTCFHWAADHGAQPPSPGGSSARASDTLGPSSEDKKELDPDFDLIMDPSLAKNEWPEKLDEIGKDPSHVSLMAQVVKKEVFERLKDKKSAVAGWTLSRAINTGTMYPSSFVGIHAADLDCYTGTFSEVFVPVVEAYHKGFKVGEHKHVTDLDPSKIETTLSASAQQKIISTRIRVARNLAMFPLNPGGNKETRLDIVALMQKVFEGLEGDFAGDFFLHSSMTEEQRKGLIADHFLFRGADKMQAASGYHEHWPLGRGIFHNKAKTFLLWVNEGDHLRIISMENGGDVVKVAQRLHDGIKAIEESLRKVTGSQDVFMTDPTLGCITCCPSNLGTGMRGSVHILVPKLIARMGLEGIDKICRERNCQARGSSGEHSEVIDRIDVSNWRRLGFTEYELVQDMINAANYLAELEDQIPDKLETGSFQGSLYAKANQVQTQAASNFFAGFDFNGKVVLDCGSGEGRALRGLLANFQPKKVYAFDASESQIATARETDEKFDYFVATFDDFLEKRPELKGQVDVVISNFAIQFAPCLNRFFSLAANTLKPGGHLWAAWPVSPMLGPSLRVAQQHEQFRPYLADFPIDERQPNGVKIPGQHSNKHWLKMTLQALQPSFDLTWVHKAMTLLPCPNREGVKRLIGAGNPARALIPQELAADFDEFVVSDFLKRDCWIEEFTLCVPVMQVRVQLKEPQN